MNLLATACYKVDNMYGNTNHEDYVKLTEKCCKSFLANLKDLHKVVIFDGHKENFSDLFQELYYKVKDYYLKNQPCNILFVDSDTICLKPVSIFNQWDKFAMFNSAEQHRHSYFNSQCLNLVQNLTPWMMANVRYYPAGLPDSIWDIGDDLAYSWIDEWAYDTIIYNKMFHSQDLNIINFLRPELNFQVEGDLGMISRETVRDASILHCHATRNSNMAIQKMDRAIKLSGLEVSL